MFKVSTALLVQYVLALKEDRTSSYSVPNSPTTALVMSVVSGTHDSVNTGWVEFARRHKC